VTSFKSMARQSQGRTRGSEVTNTTKCRWCGNAPWEHESLDGQPEPIKAWVVEINADGFWTSSEVVIGTEADAFAKSKYITGPYEFTIAVKP
jgi:hypothetical protein